MANTLTVPGKLLQCEYPLPNIALVTQKKMVSDPETQNLVRLVSVVILVLVSSFAKFYREDHQKNEKAE